MSRFFLALCLFLCAATAMAGDQVAADDNAANGVKPGKLSATSTAQDDDATAGAHPAAHPASSGTTHAVTPRWHRLLPGMIR